MRDILGDLISQQPLDPSESARRSMRGPVRKRFYESVGVAHDGTAFAIQLDGKPVRTPARRSLAAPVRPIAEALAAEWQAQTRTVDPATMPLTRLVNAIVDGVADAPGPVAEEIGQYLGSDLICYRADGPEGLLALQAQHWDPVLDWARTDFGARLILAQGMTFAEQPASALTALHSAIPTDPWRLGAVSSATTLTGSALIALALAHGRLTLDEAWTAAHVDEDWNVATWGQDDLALERRAYRFAEMRAAATVLDALR